MFRSCLKFCSDTFTASNKAVPPHQCLLMSIPLIWLAEVDVGTDAASQSCWQEGVKAGICVHGDHSLTLPSTFSREILYTSTVFCLAVLLTREMLGLSIPGRVFGQAAGQGGSSQNSACVTGCAAAKGLVVITGSLQK